MRVKNDHSLHSLREMWREVKNLKSKRQASRFNTAHLLYYMETLYEFSLDPFIRICAISEYRDLI